MVRARLDRRDDIDYGVTPPWLEKDLRSAGAHAAPRVGRFEGEWGNGRGARRKSLSLLGHVKRHKPDETATKATNRDMNEID